MRLSITAKKIITSRLYDVGVHIEPEALDDYIVNADSFKDNNEMYNFLVDNYGTLIIE